MRNATPRSDPWFGSALALVAGVTALRLLALAFNRTDLFVDESQYWLWGQTLDWGYYSKPPLIAWVIRAVTDLAGSDSAFWVRMPGPLLHGVTALVLGAVAARLFGARAALWVAVGYVTLPMVTVGSLLFSTDTVMLPLLAAALWFWVQVVGHGRLRDAALAGACIGLATLAKYAGLYAIPGLALAAVIVPAWRVGWRAWAAMLAAAVLVVSPNIAWNIANDLTTLLHTADNAGWVRTGAALRPGALLRFWAEQFAVVGPVVAGAFLWRLCRARGAERALVAIALPPLAIVSVQALLGGANANWAVAGWLTGALVAFAALPRAWALAAVAVNAVAAVALPVMTLVPDVPLWQPVMQRYLGRAALSREIVSLAAAEGLPVVADGRDGRGILADLFHTGRDADVAFYARPVAGRPGNFFEQMHAMPPGLSGPVLFVARSAGGCAAAPFRRPDLDGGAYAGSGLALWRVEAACLRGGD